MTVVDRREFLAAAGSCAAWLGWALGGLPAGARSLFAARPGGPVVAREPWGRIERVAEGAWALISTPLSGGEGAGRTVSNGGIVAGRDGVLVVEGFASEAGAAWWRERAVELTGRPPDHVILTHYHGDHSTGLAAYAREGAPRYATTRATLDRLESGGRSAAAVEALSVESTRRVGEAPVTIDLGGRIVRVVPRAGHTASDLVVVVEEPRLVWCGDLVWNGLFPNYVDATPSVLSGHVRALLEEPAERWVPGHGSLADRAAMERYVALLDDVEAAARRGLEAGTPVEAIVAAYRPPASLGAWTLFSPRYYEVALRAWERELRPAGGAGQAGAQILDR